jgi:dTDP-4-dehydrorhamnose 3,5-epimerase
MHFQVPPGQQTKLISVQRGKILDVAVDVRRGSPTFGKYVSIELSADDGRQFYIPVGFAHAFLTLEDDVIVNYRTSNYYAPASEGGIRWDDPDIGVSWPVQPSEITISERDRRLPLLKKFDSPFGYDGSPLEPLKIPGLE